MDRILINKGWLFFKGCESLEGVRTASGVDVDLPHTWNNFDGQDGGSDYYRGKCCYCKELEIEKVAGIDYYLEFRGVNAVAEVYVNGSFMCRHEGGFSTFRVRITDAAVNGKNSIAVFADNSPSDSIYPQMADFTFFGGIYRNVYLIKAPTTRFDLDYLGSEGVAVTPKVNADGSADIEVRAYFTGDLENATATCAISFGEKTVFLGKKSAESQTVFECTVSDPVLWDGLNNPALYKADVSIEAPTGNDSRTVKFGIRTMTADKDGFKLNGKSYPLRGVARHQDRLDMGWAITEAEHKQDIELINEVGANTIRLAHYQHDQYFYDLCDEYGMVVWAEIPYISSHLPNGNANAVSQMKELITQNYNHASIFCWGLSNEITITGESEGVTELHHELNDLCHAMDSTRPTTMAHVSMLDPDSPLVSLSDIMSYNHYFGWYVGDVNGNAEWLDDFRARYPERTIGISEYGCEAVLGLHSSTPKQGDYTEEYQAYYHENLIRIIEERPYLWATHVWNMFDFGVDGRNEGGVQGRNNKGLVTYDRKTKKDSFYVYKAHWSKEPFVHIASKRYFYRAERVTKVKVYSNADVVTLCVNGKEFARQEGKYVFTFDVPLRRFFATRVVAVSGDLRDEATFKYVRKPYASYILKGEESVENWFDKDGKFDFKYPEGYFSIKDKLNSIMATPEGAELIDKLMERVVKEMMSGGDGKSGGEIKISKGMLKMVGGMTIERIAGMIGDKVSAEMIYEVNEMLNKIAKPGKA